MKHLATFVLLTTVCLAPAAGAQTALPVVEDVEFAALRAQCRHLAKTLEVLRAPLPADLAKELLAVLGDGEKNPGRAAERLQQLLDPLCLISVNINPESRVKAARGPAAAELSRDRPVFVLVKVQNEAGVTHALDVTGPQLLLPERRERGRWLEAVVPSDRALARTLTGQKLEYVVLRLTAREAGKREATLRFDVGQGTQDLGFRAEVPVLFTVR